jgi:mannose-6-phosphate isomerase-like protein (cupin superfamily)
MPRLIPTPTIVQAAGHPPKRIEEYVGTLVLRGVLRVEFEGGVLDVGPGQAVTTAPGDWVRYGTPGPEGAEYVAICLPAFTPATVHRDG